jgi:hypothetical protein
MRSFTMSGIFLTIILSGEIMNVAILNPTTIQFIEKMAALFPDGISIVGPRGDQPQWWDALRPRMREWWELGLKISWDELAFQDVNFDQYDLLIESAETFMYSKTWAQHCTRPKCPRVLKACWTRDPLTMLPTHVIKDYQRRPVFLEMSSHVEAWQMAGFEDVTALPNPVGDWWFKKPWTGDREVALFVLAGKNLWRDKDPARLGLDWWEKLCQTFPGRTLHHDAATKYLTPLQMTELFRGSRVFVNLDTPYGDGERPLALAFTEALAAGMPVVARNLPGLDYHKYIGLNGECSNSLPAIMNFIDKCFYDWPFACRCGELSREIALKRFSVATLWPQYLEIFERAA